MKLSYFIFARHISLCIGLIASLFVDYSYAENSHTHSPFVGKCGTAQLFLPENQKSTSTVQSYSFSSYKTNKEVAVQATPLPSRMYQSRHFVFYYNLDTTLHAPVLSGSEKNLPTQADSIQRANNSSLQEAYNTMDQNNFPHPQYVLKNAEYFENAWDYYIDTLKMRTPTVTTPSHFFKRANVPNKYPVEIVHISAAEPQVASFQVYGLAYSPGIGGAGILMENDFRYGENQTPLITQYQEVTPHIITNYGIEWEKAVKVTAAHEFYHAIQYAYTPNVSNFHYWYEISATGMEERLAPEVNDYLQYLPITYETHRTYSLNSRSASSLQTYGNGIFHQFLTKEIGKSFDVEVWSNLALGGAIDSVLQNMFSNHNKNIRDIYSKYTRPLPFTQPTSSLVPGFSPDHNIWPRVTPVFVREGVIQFSLPPLTYEAIDFSSSITSPKSLVFNPTESDGAVLTVVYADNVTTHTLPQNEPFVLPLSSKPSKLVVSNGSWKQNASIVLSLSNIEAYPNPVSQNTGTIQFSNFIEDKISPATGKLQVFNEQGVLVYSADLSEQQTTWNLKNSTGKKIPSGVYYYTVAGQSAKMLYVQ